MACGVAKLPAITLFSRAAAATGVSMLKSRGISCGFLLYP